MVTIRKLTEEEAASWHDGFPMLIPSAFRDEIAVADIGDVFELRFDSAVSARLCADMRRVARECGRYITLRLTVDRHAVWCRVESLIQRQARSAT